MQHAPSTSRTAADVEVEESVPAPKRPKVHDDSDVELIDDIEKLIKANMDVSEIESAIKSLTPGQKYHLLKHYFKPDATFVFPTTEMSGFNRSFQYAWLKRFPWLVYSKSLDGGFCLPCALFAKNRQNLHVLVNNPFIQWIKLKEKVDGHKDRQYHRNAQIDADQFLHSVEHPEGTLPVMTDSEKEKRIQVNRHIVRCIAEGVLYCGRQCIALRGDHESLKTQGNPGNFLAPVWSEAV